MSTILAALAVLAQASSGLLVSPSELAAMLKDPTVVVVAVGQPNEFEAGHVPGARFVRYGEANGGAIETGPQIKHRLDTDLTPKVQAQRVVSADWIKERLSSQKMTLLDARPDAEFTGADGGMNGMHVKGHLPDAQQLVWNTLLDSSGKFLPDAELRKKYEAIGAAKGTPLVSYCMVGMRASVTYFVARHLGYDARMYDGSIVDWTRRKLPAVMGQ